MYSSIGDAIDRITAAIDRLAIDAQGKAGESELAARVAELWEMIGDLDPELARRRDRYTTADGGTPSA